MNNTGYGGGLKRLKGPATHVSTQVVPDFIDDPVADRPGYLQAW